MSEPATYIRVRRARTKVTVHRPDCRFAVDGTPWDYARGFTSADIAHAVAKHDWLRACRTCQPDVELFQEANPRCDR